MRLEFRLTSGSSRAEGEVYARPYRDNPVPIVTDVVADRARSSRFELGPGKYVVKFHFVGGGDVCEVDVKPTDGGRPLATKECDTGQFGLEGWTLRFEVPA